MGEGKQIDWLAIAIGALGPPLASTLRERIRTYEDQRLKEVVAVVADIIEHLEEMVPQDRGYRHLEGNSPAHIKAAIIGGSQSLLIEEGRLVLGTWQGLFFAEFDGPRSRSVLVKIAADRD